MQYVIMDETWFHHFTPETKRQFVKWTEARESRPKQPEAQQSAGKVRALVLGDFMDYLEKGKPSTASNTVDCWSD